MCIVTYKKPVIKFIANQSITTYRYVKELDSETCTTDKETGSSNLNIYTKNELKKDDSEPVIESLDNVPGCKGGSVVIFGFRTFKTKDKAYLDYLWYPNREGLTLAIFEIPKGSIYYESEFGHIASNQIIFKEYLYEQNYSWSDI